MTRWMKCRKLPIEVEYREVNGKAEVITTREGKLYAHRNVDFIIKGVDGELYPIKKDIFSRTYEVIEHD